MTSNENMNVLGEKFKKRKPTHVLTGTPRATDSKGRLYDIKTLTIPNEGRFPTKQNTRRVVNDEILLSPLIFPFTIELLTAPYCLS